MLIKRREESARKKCLSAFRDFLSSASVSVRLVWNLRSFMSDESIHEASRRCSKAHNAERTLD